MVRQKAWLYRRIQEYVILTSHIGLRRHDQFGTKKQRLIYVARPLGNNLGNEYL